MMLSKQILLGISKPSIPGADAHPWLEHISSMTKPMLRTISSLTPNSAKHFTCSIAQRPLAKLAAFA
jgi:hypothetical protein